MEVRFVEENHAITKRPKKRRKLGKTEAEPTQAAGDDAAITLQDAQDVETDGPPLPTLPRFPQPTQPDAPSKSTLALQGQDRALIEAELIDPQRTVSIVEVGVSDRTSQRLKDLGIQELFAGALHPVLVELRTCLNYIIQCRPQ